MTKDKADALEIAIATRMIKDLYRVDYEDLSPAVQKHYRDQAAEFIAMTIAATKETEE